jgi:hypothetical protein
MSQINSVIRATLTSGSLLLLALIPLGGALPAQQLSLGAGYTKMDGRIGDSESDHGVIVRLGIDLVSRAHLSWSLEGGMERLNEVHRQSTTTCVFPPGGGTGQCHFDIRNRDTGWSLGTTLRIAPNEALVRPYALVGLGFLTVREHERQLVTDDNGATLPNFTFDASFNDQALQGHLGAGLTARPAKWPVALYAEGRMTRLIHNYSGGIVGNWNPTVVVGIRR